MALSEIHIAILGGGSVGSTLAKALQDSAKFASVKVAARNVEKTTAQLEEKGLSSIQVGPSKEVLEAANVVILATPSIQGDAQIQELAAGLGDMTDKVIIDATNPLGEFAEGLNIRWQYETSGGEVLAKALPTAKVYKSFNTVGVEHMKDAKGKTMMLAGDEDEASKEIAEAVVGAVGFDPFYVGPIRYARNLEAMAELWIHMAIPPLGARTTSRNFWFSISGEP